MIEKPSIPVGIRKTVRRIINHPWFVAIAGSIIAGIILYILLDRLDILAEIKIIMSGSVTISILWIITITACVIIVVIAYYILLRRNKTHTKDRPTKKKTSRKSSKKIVTILSPRPGLCLGRDTELSQLEKDLTHKNILLIKGIAGIGKTTLGLKFKDNLEKKGYKTFWSQIGYNSYEGFLSELSEYLKKRGSVYADHITREVNPERRFKIAVQELCEYPTVVFLDDFQKLEDDSVFKVFRNYLRNSTLVIMSRIRPTFLLEDYENLPYLDKQSSVTLLRELGLKESEAVLEKIFEKTLGHPWSLERFAEFSYNIPAEKLFEGIPNFSEDQQAYIFEQYWKTLSKNERDFLMRASVFTKPLDFDALEMCSKDIPTVIMSLARRFYITKREEYYYIHDIIRDFAFLELKKDEKLYGEAQREAAGYYRKNVSAENLLLVHYHLKGAGEYREGIELIVDNIEYFWREGFWSDVKKVLEESLSFFDDDEMIARICNKLGTIVYMLDELDKALEYHKKHLEISEQLGDMSGIARAYCNLGLVYFNKCEWDKALEYHKKDLVISEQLGDMSGIARAYCNLGLAYFYRGEWDKALEYHKKHLEISEKLGDMSGIARAYGNLGLTYFYRGEWDKALKCSEKCLEISEKLGDMLGIAKSYGGLESLYHYRGEWDKALEYHKKDLEISEKLGDMSGISRAYGHIGSVYYYRGEWGKALDYQEKRLEISEKLGNKSRIALAYGNLGSLYHDKGEWDKALEYHEKCLEISEKLGDIYIMAYSFGEIGRVHCSRGEWDRALEYHEKHLEISEKLGDAYGMALAYRNIGEVQYKRDQWDRATEYYERSLRISEKLGDIYNVACIYRGTGDISFAKKEYKQALDQYLKASEIFNELGAKHELTITKERISNTYENLE